MEIKLSGLAEQMIKQEMSQLKEKLWLRIYVSETSCHGAKFGMAFDDIKDGDEISNINGIDLITDTQYIPEYCNGLSIDYVVSPSEGFVIKSLGTQSSTGCGGCKEKGGDCSCGKRSSH